MFDIVFYIGIDGREAYQKCMNLTTVDNGIHIGEQLEQSREGDIIVVCNGNIYNYKQLAEEHDIEGVVSGGELIIGLYKKYGMLICSRLLYGEFSFVLLEMKELPIYGKKFIVDCYIVNDNLGVKPLFIGFNDGGKVCGVASKESYLKGMNMKLFPPGFYLSNLNEMVNYTQLFEYESDQKMGAKRDPISVIINNVKLFVKNAIKVRSNFGEKRVAFLLENSFHSALVNKFLDEDVLRIPLFDSNERKLVVEEVAHIVKEVIELLSNCDPVIVRRGVLLYLLARWMRKSSEYEVIICNEVTVGVEMIICQKCFAKFGIEVRFPLIDQKVVKYLASVGDDHRLFKQVFTDIVVSVGVSGEDENYLSAIREYVDKAVVNEGGGEGDDGGEGGEGSVEKEKIFYKNIYKECFEKR